MRKTKAFTLLELLIVVAIISLLAVIAIPNFNAAQVRSKVARSKADMRTLETALETYAVDNMTYPPGSEGFVVPDYSIYNLRLHPLTTPISYISSLPMDPFNTGYPGEYSGPRPGTTTYDYNTYDALMYIWVDLGVSPEEARRLWLERYGNGYWKLVGIGPNGQFAVDDWGAVRYDPTNGTHSNGDIVLTPAVRF